MGASGGVSQPGQDPSGFEPELEERHKRAGVSLGRLSVSSEATDRFRKLGKVSIKCRACGPWGATESLGALLKSCCKAEKVWWRKTF